MGPFRDVLVGVVATAGRPSDGTATARLGREVRPEGEVTAPALVVALVRPPVVAHGGGQGRRPVGPPAVGGPRLGPVGTAA